MGWVLFSTAQVRRARAHFFFSFQPGARGGARPLAVLSRTHASTPSQVLLTSVTLGVLQKNGVIT